MTTWLDDVIRRREEKIRIFQEEEHKRRLQFDAFIQTYRSWGGSLRDLLRTFPHYKQHIPPIMLMMRYERPLPF
jgi:hypothetical protein